MEDNQSSSQNTNNSKAVIGVVVVLVVVIAGYFFFKNGYNAPTVQNKVVPTKETQTSTTENQVTIQNFSFSPQTLNIKVGTTVTWANEDSAAHTVISDNDGPLKSNNLNKGESYSFTFNEAGEFAYHCSIHSSVQGKVVVQ